MSEKILIVDDDMDTLRLVGMLLQRKGYQINAASNGAIALEKARADQPDLILLDVMMPDMNGYEVLRRLRAIPGTKNTPVIMFTAKAQVDDKVAGFEAGADDYLTKPTHPAELLARVKSILARAKTEAVAAPPARTSATTPRKAGTVIGVMAAKSSQGVSTVALNLAAVFAKTGKEACILADFQPGDAGVSGLLGYHVQEGLTTLFQIPVENLNTDEVRSAIIQHASGVNIMPVSYLPSDASLYCKAEHFSVIINHLKMIAPFIVLDLGSRMLPGIEKAVEACDQIIVVCEPMTQSMMPTKALLGELSLRVTSLGQINLVLNTKARGEGMLPLRDAQDRLGHAVALSFTSAPELTHKAAARCVPLVQMDPDSILSQQFTKLAQTLLKTIQG